MSIQISFPLYVLTYTKEEFNKWVNGEREQCLDPYCLKLPNSYGFGEFIVGQHFSSLGYKWIHHDFNVFGGNRPEKYPLAEEILIGNFGKEKYESARTLYRAFKNIEEPDLLIYRPDYSEIRFAESKRLDSHDKLRENQVRGLILLSALLGCKADVFEIVEEGKDFTPEPIIWEF
ncbi:hypothetical protein [Desulfosporosinus sp. OT]|uniref:hypothetical protein n=1 Tax=Desulfosporosinus sp. OT TaxID=913865 RepID=UPI000223A073|nr:hypothetical protein [Desulfosporosinus sp. OT]EGW36653.1 hypothetical protein DOT_5518 [Desulfosporosinus sp. OT]